MSLYFRFPQHEVNASAYQRALDAMRSASMSGFFDLPLQTIASPETQACNFLAIFGMGGSSLGARAALEALGGDCDLQQRNFFIDNSDPQELERMLRHVPPEQSIVYLISKSGGTIEVLTALNAAKSWLARAKSVRIVCGPGEHALSRWADAHALQRENFGVVPTNVGGRYSVLSDVGLRPLASAGIDIDALLNGARAMRTHILDAGPESVVARFASLHAAQTTAARSTHVLFAYRSGLRAFTDWYVQLWSESLGKPHSQIRMPTALAAIGARDQHSQLQLFAEGPDDKVYTFLSSRSRESDLPTPSAEASSMLDLLDAQCKATFEALEKVGRPVIWIESDRLDAYHLGALFFFYEAACALCGFLLGIDPFDQPGVEMAKKLTRERLRGSASFPESVQIC